MRFVVTSEALPEYRYETDDWDDAEAMALTVAVHTARTVHLTDTEVAA